MNIETQQTLVTLKAARELISDADRWTQGRCAKDIDGDRVDVRSSSAVCWCSIGAILKDSRFSYALAALAALSTTVGPSRNFAEYNDTHNHVEVLALWDKTIARLEGEL